MIRRLAASSGVALAVLAFAGTAMAVSPYPAVLPDFSHAGVVHGNYYGVQAGQTDRPMLVVLRGFTDLNLPAGFDENWAATTFLGGGFPSLANYFANDSFGDLNLTPAAETCGTSNNGVAVATTGTRVAFDGQSEADRNRSSVDAVDGCVNFAAFDTNSDGQLSNLELVIFNVTAPTSAAENCGATRGISGGAIDGKSFPGNYGVGMGTTATNLMTHIHEMGHVALDMRDLYGFGVGSLDISGPTCGGGNGLYMRSSAWQKLHWGWIAPTVVTNDGYYMVDRADSNGSAFILYDYARGANDYFIVENRQRVANTYDQSASDSGLVIWRVDETQYASGSDAVRPIEIMRPDGVTTPGCTASGCYGGSNGDAWNPADSATPQRTMARTWRAGTASNVAVRAIGPSGNAIRAYFDVRGPGILVDPTNAQGAPRQFDVTPEEASAVDFTVMNTGEVADTFAFSIVGLPTGWSSTVQTLNLGAGAGATANVSVTVPADAPTGVYTVRARGVSTTDGTVATEGELRLRVVLHETRINYTGATARPWGEPAGFAAQLRDMTVPSDVVDGAAVTFTLSDGTNSQSAVATSDLTGLASANPVLTVPPGPYTLTISMPRHGKHGPATTSVGYTVLKRPTTITYTGDTTAQYSDPALARAVLADATNGTPLSARSVVFQLGTQSAAASTDVSGVAQTAIVLDQPASSVTVTATFAEDALYLGSTTSAPFEITKEDLTFAYTGDTLTSGAVTPTLSAQATQAPDGSPGDLSLAEATFALAPTLTTTPFAYTTGVNASGAAATPATALPVDLWTVTIDVPSTNQYWTGASLAPAELVVFDPNGKLNGGAQGLDSAGERTRVNVVGEYKADEPRGRLSLDATLGSFSGREYLWIVVVGNQSVAEIEGDLAGVTYRMRIRLLDGGEPARTADTYRAWLRDSVGTVVYDTGVVAVDRGNLQVGIR